MSGEYVKLLIPPEAEKGGKDRVYPVTPDFAEFLLAVPMDQRTGFVFDMMHRRLQVTRRIDTASKQIADIGRLANVKVDQQGDKAIHATAHDLRQAFVNDGPVGCQRGPEGADAARMCEYNGEILHQRGC
jgi:integrase